MARYITVGTIGARPRQVDSELSLQEAVDQMITFWAGKLDLVVPDRPDLVVVPEYCDEPDGYPRDRLKDYYTQRGEQVLDFFKEKAKRYECHIAYSSPLQIGRDRTWRNSTVLIDRAGQIAGTYNKNHIVIGELKELGEARYGKAPAVIECDFGRVGCAICFDLNFDELRRQYTRLRPDLLIFCSQYHGGLMQAYWAYSCRCHFVASLSGLPSAILSPVGQVVASTTNYFDHVTARINLDCRVAHLDGNWERLDAAKAKYGSQVRIVDPGFLGSILISSETDAFTVEDVIKEFEIELLEDYFSRSLDDRNTPGHIEL